MKTLFLTLLILIIIQLCITIYICFIRNIKVYNFRKYIADLIYLKSVEMLFNNISMEEIDHLWNIIRKVSYNKMLFSFKPLKLEYWFTNEEIEKITK